MKLHYIYCIPDQETLDKYKNWDTISKDQENRTMCIYREKWLEIEHFSKTGNCIFWSNGRFLTPDFKKANSFSPFIARMSIEEYEIFMKINNLTEEFKNYQTIIDWYGVIPEKYTKRKMYFISSKEAENNFDHYYGLVKNNKNQFFAKSVYKHWSYAGSYEGWIESGAAFSICHEKSKILISEFLQIKEDEMPPLTVEYRCFYIYGKLLSISRYVDYENHIIPDYITEFAKTLETEIISIVLPKTVVIDIADTIDRGPVFLEANDVSCSGRYHNNKLNTFPLDIGI